MNSNADVSDAVNNTINDVATAVREGKRKGRPVDPTSRIGQARAIYDAATDRSRKSLIAQFTQIEGVSKQVASAYYHQIVKALGK